MGSITIPRSISRWINNVLKYVEADVWHVKKIGKKTMVMVNYKIQNNVVKVMVEDNGFGCHMKVLSIFDIRTGERKLFRESQEVFLYEI